MRPGALPRFPNPSPLVVAVSSPSRVAWARSPPPPPMRPPPPSSCPRGRPPPRHQHLRLRRLVCLYLHISSPNSTANEIPTAAVVDPLPPPPSSPLLCLICELGLPLCLVSPASSLPPSSPCSLGFLLTSIHIDSCRYWGGRAADLQPRAEDGLRDWVLGVGIDLLLIHHLCHGKDCFKFEMHCLVWFLLHLCWFLFMIPKSDWI